MRSILIICIVGLCLSSCADNKVEMVPEDKMAIIMSDLLLADYTMRQYQTGIRDSVKSELMKSLLKVHRLTRAELDTNLYLYSVDYDKYEHLLELVEGRLDSLKKAADNKEPTIMPLSTKIK